MKFLKKNKKEKSKAAKVRKVSAKNTPALSNQVEDGSADGDLNENDIANRKAEFLKLLAKEERAHRVKIAKMRNEPIEERRSERDDSFEDAAENEASMKAQSESAEEPKSKTKKALSKADIERSFEEKLQAQKVQTSESLPVTGRLTGRLEPQTSEKLAPRLSDIPADIPAEIPAARIKRPTESETRAAIGKEIGGEDFQLTRRSGFDAPNFDAKLRGHAKAEDVTPQRPEQKRPEQKRNSARDSEFYKASTADASRDPYADMDFTRPAQTGHANVKELKLDVARITSDIENGDALYRRAQQRVRSLMHFAERAEVDFSLLERIEPENRRLKARTATLEKDLEEETRKAALIETELDEHRRRLAEVNVQYDTVNGNLAKAMRALAERDREIRQVTNDISALTLKLDREKTTTEVEIRENNILRERVVNLTNDLEDLKAARGESNKSVESLKFDLEEHRAARERLENETYDLRHALDAAQKQNTQMKGEMVALHQDISTFKTQYEFNIISRDDRITMLESQIEDLARQLQIKEDIVQSAARDVTELRKSRTSGELERERLEKQIDAQTQQLDMVQNKLVESQSRVEELDDRYRDVAAALSIAQNRRTHQAPAQNPDIQPAPNTLAAQGAAATNVQPSLMSEMQLPIGQMPAPAPASAAAPHTASAAPPPPAAAPRDDLSTLSPESIQDRIMDYKLGLRKNIF